MAVGVLGVGVLGGDGVGVAAVAILGVGVLGGVVPGIVVLGVLGVLPGVDGLGALVIVVLGWLLVDQRVVVAAIAVLGIGVLVVPFLACWVFCLGSMVLALLSL